MIQIRKIKYMIFLPLTNTKQRTWTSVEISKKIQEVVIFTAKGCQITKFFGILEFWKNFKNPSYLLNS